MTDFAGATMRAMLARLEGQVGAPVFEQVPDQTVAPVVMFESIGADLAADGATKDAPGRSALVTVQFAVFAAGRNKAQLRAIVAAVTARLAGWTPTPAGGLTWHAVQALGAEETDFAEQNVRLAQPRFQVRALA